jgi:hypothetical protein
LIHFQRQELPRSPELARGPDLQGHPFANGVRIDSEMRCNPVYWQPAFGHCDFLVAYPAKNQTVGTIGLGNDANEAVQENQFKSGGNEEDECAGSRTRRWLNLCMATKMQDTLGHPLGDPTFGYPLNSKGGFQVHLQAPKTRLCRYGNHLLPPRSLGPKAPSESSALCRKTPSSGPS